MSEPSALSLKIGNRPSPRQRSAFSPDMLLSLCSAARETLGALLETKVTVTLDSVGLEALADALPDEGPSLCAAVMQVNGIVNAATVLPDDRTLFHVIDIMLGADPSTDEPVEAGMPSALYDRFCIAFADAVTGALKQVCHDSFGAGSFVQGLQTRLAHDREALFIVPATTDILTVRFTVEFGRGGRVGAFALHLPLHVIDSISGASDRKSAPFVEDGPWPTHMCATVLGMELEVLARIHTESMTLAALSRLEIGQILPLSSNAVGSVSVFLEEGGDFLTSGELGIRSGKRAVSVDSPPDAAFLKPAMRLADTSSNRRASEQV